MTTARRVVAAVLALAAIAPVMAADWRFDPQAGFTATYDDNYRLASSGGSKQGVATGIVSLSEVISGRTQTSIITLVPRLRYAANSPSIDQNSTDGFLDINMQHTGQTSTVSLLTNYSHQNVFRLYQQSAGINFDLGSFSTTQGPRSLIARNSQDLLQVNPSASWKLTQRARFSLAAYHTDSSYSQHSSDYINYHNTYGSATVSYDATRRDTVSFSGTGSQFESATSTSATNTYGVQAEWRRTFSDISRYYFRLGDERSHFGRPIPIGGQTSANSVSAGAGVNWVWQINGLFVDATRNVYPNSTGNVSQQTEVRVRFQHLMSPKVQSWISFDGVQYSYFGGTSSAADGSRWLSANLGLEWRVTQVFSIQPTLDLVQQKLNRNSTNAQSNTIGLSFLYSPGRRAQSAAVRVQSY